jgi:hypothetical protein
LVGALDHTSQLCYQGLTRKNSGERVLVPVEERSSP